MKPVNLSAATSITLHAAALSVVVCSSVVVAMPGEDPAEDDVLAGIDYSQPLNDLNAPGLRSFAAGQAEFAARWVPPFLSGGHWGRGPQSNAESCLSCHPGNGRGRAPDGPGEPPHSLVLRLAKPGTDEAGRPQPHPAYGTHLNRHGILGQLIEEGDFRVEYSKREVALADGSRVELRSPTVRLAALWYGPTGDDTTVSLRLAQPVFGLGLLEAVADSTILDLAEQQQRIGFNGRPNRVIDEATGEYMIGRFAHKASQPYLRHQVAAAFHDEMGVTSNLFPQEQCWPIQKACYRVERVIGVEARDEQLDSITDYLRLLAAPRQREMNDPLVRRGAGLFDKAKCSVCHVPELKTGSNAVHAQLRNRTIRPYTDLLLHDMGDGLADGRREFDAGGRDWRTPPLWGIGLRAMVNGNSELLHDGRARNVTEAILWHGGEADVSRQEFINMNEQDRRALLRFVESL
ncbi:MAG: c-type cytochrome [Betaproteobacteria bacterium]|nr:MAG: c-type cytochrome [Betaproteobacteria bacterium]